MNRLERRVAALERARSPGGLVVIEIHGGLNSGVASHANAGGHTWKRGPDEAEADFRVRVRAEAQATWCPMLIFGGLPG